MVVANLEGQYLELVCRTDPVSEWQPEDRRCIKT